MSDNIVERLTNAASHAINRDLLLTAKDALEAKDKRIEKLEQLTAMIASRSHICSGRDCVGMWIEETGSLLRCNTCEQFRIAIADMEQT